MGNIVSLSPCFNQNKNSSSKLIFWDGNTRTLTGKHVGGEIMFEFPNTLVLHADSFFIGQPIPALQIDDELIDGQTYFVLPIDYFSCQDHVLSASSLSALGSVPNPKKTTINFGECPFEYIKGSNGRVLIRVLPELIIRLINRGKECDDECGNGNSYLCSTPELQKHYNQLVGTPKGNVWSPKLETISEYKIRYSPCRFLGLEWKLKEKEG